MNVRKIAAVAQREYAQTVKTKAFLIGAIVMPLVIVVLIGLSMKFQIDQESKVDPIELAVVDRTHRVADCLVKLAAGYNADNGVPPVNIHVEPGTSDAGDALDSLKRRVDKDEFFATICIPADVIEAEDTPCIVYTRAGSFGSRRHTVQWLVGEAVKCVRIAEANLDFRQVMHATRGVRFEQRDVNGKPKGEMEEVTGVMTPLAFAMLLFVGVFGVSQSLLTSLIEEKGSRIVEVLLSALSPFELMSGKILGIAGVGFTLVLIWATAAYGAATWKGLDGLLRIDSVGQFLLYYVLGFLLFSSMLAALGSACNSLKEAQSLMGPLSIVIVIPLACWLYIVRNPDSLASTVLSFIPPITPLVMILRTASPVSTGLPLWQQIGAPIWLAAWVVVTIWAASRIFRVGILLYGKPPGLFELVKWIGRR